MRWAGLFLKSMRTKQEKGSSDRFRASGLASSQQLARAGHSVTLFEKNDRIGVFSAMVYRTLKWKNIILIKE